jgi:16S rRNA G966 N2-methylase RsmD/ssDNA-binding Zn-finger/Zn-ribbon topoisomerase 1
MAVVPEELVVGRGDPVYMAHAYLTKVPVPAIVPFIEAHTKPGDLVLDPFAGSGMTGVAAAVTGRRAVLFDISVLGQHIGRNYVNIVDAELARKQADAVVRATRDRLGDIYGVDCEACGQRGQLAKTVCSAVVECSGCHTPVSFYRVLEAAHWQKSAMRCPNCASEVSSRQRRVGEASEVAFVDCPCSSKQREQTAQEPQLDVDVAALNHPRVEITPDRQMYKASALGKHGTTTIASFYSPRNLAVLTVLRDEIAAIEDAALRAKLTFAFTACLTRASKRYQWSRQRPLNAANANYYVAPVFYEWNVFDLFLRKVEAVLRSDDWIVARRAALSDPDDFDVSYELSSAEQIPLADRSVDYVFMDPPFGSNLFYADMALFQEAWLDGFTPVEQEAVVGRGRREARSATRYEELLTKALSECHRVLRPGGRISMVFGNSTGGMWAIVQRAVRNAGLRIEPERLVVLNKGQRSVKGLASGFEHVATLDLIMTMVPADGEADLVDVDEDAIVGEVRAVVARGGAQSPSHVYLELLRAGLRNGWNLSGLHLRAVTTTLLEDGWRLDAARGLLTSAKSRTSPAPSPAPFSAAR